MYASDIAINKLSETGVNFESVINKLPYHYVLKNVSMDIMHDIFEGVALDLFKYFITQCIERNIMTLDTINSRLLSFQYERHYTKSKPSLLKVNFIKGEKTILQSTSKIICLVTCIPLIFGDLFESADDLWKLLLLFREVVDVVMSPSIRRAGILYLRTIINEFLHVYIDVIKNNLKPKHHHLLHYPDSIKMIGPL